MTTVPDRLPYPGLRAYRREETDLFFGRDGCVNDMVDRLAATRFLAVLGASGSGKSSLVRTGLLDALALGLYAEAGSRWTVADCSPGGAPMRNLAAALLEAAGNQRAEDEAVDMLEGFLGQGPLSLAEWYEDGPLPEGRNLLVLVDQFEELFRFRDYAGREQAEAFVALLLESTRANPRIHVTITMRSEYLGNCALIPGLAEAINSGLYLARRMTREECRAAIEGPAAVIGFDIEPALVTRLLNDLSGFAPWETDREGSQLQRLSRQADQLPLMQHALSRMWRVAQRRGEGGRTVLRLDDYVAIGHLGGALEQHAGEVMETLGEEARALVRPIFRALVTGPALADAVRRPRPFGELVAVTGGRREAVQEAVDAFRASDCNFLRPPAPQQIDDDSIIDISHESLIRQWSSLSEWFSEEARASALWARLIHSEERHARGEEDLLGGLNLANIAAWWDQEEPNEAWAEGHGGGYAKVRAFLEESRAREEEAARREKERAEKERRSLRVRGAFYLASALVAVVFAVYGFHNQRVASAEAERATANELVAIRAGETARQAEEAARQAEAGARAAAERSERLAAQLTRFLAPIARLELADRRPAEALKLALAAWPRRGDANAVQHLEVAEALAAALPVHLSEVLMPGSSEGIKWAEFSPDGRRVATTMWDHTGRVWDAETGDLVHWLFGHTGSLNSVSYSAAGDRIVTAASDNTAIVFDAETGLEVAVLRGHTGAVLTARFSPDGARVVTGGADGTARVFNAATGAPVSILPDHQQTVRVAAFSPDGSLILTGSTDGIARLFDATNGALLNRLEGHTDWIRDAAFSPDGSRVVTGSDDMTAIVFDAATGRQIAVMGGHEDWVLAVAFSPDGRLVATGGDDNVAKVFNAATGQLVSSMEGHRFNVHMVRFSPDSELLLTASMDDTARVWDVVTGEELRSYEGHTNTLYSGMLSPSGDRVVTASIDGTAQIFDFETFEPVAVLRAAEFLVRGSGGPEAEMPGLPEGYAIRSQSAASGKLQAVLEGHADTVFTAAFSPDGTRAITSSRDWTGRIWDAATGEELILLSGHRDSVTSAFFSPDGTRALTTSLDGTAVVRDAEDGAPLVEIVAREGVMWGDFSPDGTIVATAGLNGETALWDAATGEKLRDLAGHDKTVWSIAFSPDGSRLVTASEDATARVWATATGFEVLRIVGTVDRVIYSAFFSPDGERIVTAGDERLVRIWDARSGLEMRRVSPDGTALRFAAFSRDGTRVVVSGAAPASAVYEDAVLMPLGTLDVGGSTATALTGKFSPDGSRIILALSDDTAVVTDVSMMEQGDLFAMACARLGADTDLAEIERRYGVELAPICGDNPPAAVDPLQWRRQATR